MEFVKTSTGFGFVKGHDGQYNYEGATVEDLRLMLTHVGPGVRVKASGGIRTLDEVVLLKEMGVSRVGTLSTVDVMQEACRRFGAVDTSTPSGPIPETNGY